MKYHWSHFFCKKQTNHLYSDMMKQFGIGLSVDRYWFFIMYLHIVSLTVVRTLLLWFLRTNLLKRNKPKGWEMDRGSRNQSVRHERKLSDREEMVPRGVQNGKPWESSFSLVVVLGLHIWSFVFLIHFHLVFLSCGTRQSNFPYFFISVSFLTTDLFLIWGNTLGEKVIWRWV